MEGSGTGSALPGNTLLAADLQGLGRPLREVLAQLIAASPAAPFGAAEVCVKEPVLRGTKLELGSPDLSSQGPGSFP